MTIAETILMQLGGRKFIVCTGCSNFHSSGDNDFLVMNIPRNASKANRLEIKYDYAKDAYNMRFYRHTNPRYSQKRFLEGKSAFTDAKDTEVRSFNGVYCDQLRELFTEVTGMYVPMYITINGHRFE